MNDKSRYGNLFKKEETYVEVHNLNGTSDNEPPNGYNSWKEWWENISDEVFDQCSNKVCQNDAEVGAHVQKVSGDKKRYIVPLCKQCNGISSGGSFYVKKNDLEPVVRD